MYISIERIHWPKKNVKDKIIDQLYIIMNHELIYSIKPYLKTRKLMSDPLNKQRCIRTILS